MHFIKTLLKLGKNRYGYQFLKFELTCLLLSHYISFDYKYQTSYVETVTSPNFARLIENFMILK